MIIKVRRVGAIFNWTLFDDLGLTRLSGQMYPSISKVIEDVRLLYPNENLDFRIMAGNSYDRNK